MNGRASKLSKKKVVDKCASGYASNIELEEERTRIYWNCGKLVKLYSLKRNQLLVYQTHSSGLLLSLLKENLESKIIEVIEVIEVFLNEEHRKLVQFWT